MKNILIIIALCATAANWSCNKDKLDPNSVIRDSNVTMEPFDNWLTAEYRIPYNIEVKYRAEAKDLEPNDQVVPASKESSKIIAVVLKHVWLDAFSEASPQGVDFIKGCATREIHFFGSGLYDLNGTYALGTAAGGKKMTLYDIDRYTLAGISTMTPAFLLSPGGDDGDAAMVGVFHVILHEFAHILHQLKPYNDKEFQNITPGVYVGDAWSNDNSIRTAINAGCITPYGRMQYIEDFVEILSTYIGYTPQQWERRLSKGSAEGQAAIATKLEFIKDYLQTSWSIDLDKLRDITLRRAGEINQLEFVDLH